LHKDKLDEETVEIPLQNYSKKDCMRRSEQREHDISLEKKSYQILCEKKLFSNGENMIFPFRRNQSKDCPERRSSMRT
jgi:hypothetical protein